MEKKKNTQVDVCLVSMPFSDISMPSMALSLLKSCLTDAGISSCVQYEHLYYIYDRGLSRYSQVAMSRTDALVGEMIFSKLTEDDIRSLADIGFAELQPGIDSLQDDVLNLMNKGCRAIKQLETLKHCRAHNVNAAMSGFVDSPLYCTSPSDYYF